MSEDPPTKAETDQEIQLDERFKQMESRIDDLQLKISSDAQDTDSLRRGMGSCAIVVGILSFVAVAVWAMCVAGTDPKMPHSIIVAATGLFALATMRLAEKLTLSRTVMLKIEDTKAARYAKAAEPATLPQSMPPAAVQIMDVAKLGKAIADALPRS